MISASHSRLSIQPETLYLLRFRDLLEVGRPLTRKQVDRVVGRMINHYRWCDMNFDVSEFRQLVALLQIPYLRDILELVSRRRPDYIPNRS